MAIEYLGLSSVEGPLVVLEGVQDAFYDEIVEFVVEFIKQRKWDVLWNIDEDKAIIQVFEGPRICPWNNTHDEMMVASDGGYCITGNAWKNL